MDARGECGICDDKDVGLEKEHSWCCFSCCSTNITLLALEVVSDMFRRLPTFNGENKHENWRLVKINTADNV